MRRINVARLRDLILARLAVKAKRPPSAKELSKALEPLVKREVDKAAWNAAFERALAELREARLIDAQQLVITVAGRTRLQRALGVKGSVTVKSWSEMKTKYLPRVLRPSLPVVGEKPVKLALAVLGEKLGVPLDSKSTKNQIIDRWLAVKLGLKPGARLTLDAIRATWLARELGLPERKSAAQVAGLAVTTLSGATSSSESAVNQALTSSWLMEDTANEPRPTVDTPLERIATKALRAAEKPEATRFGPSKVFIGSVWRALASDPEIAPLGENAFKRQLVEAHRRSLLVLSRADLVAAMDPNEVAASETIDGNATYHFISRGASA